MSEFKNKVEEYKQTIVEPGFTVGSESEIPESQGVIIEGESSPQEDSHEKNNKGHSRRAVSSLKRKLEEVNYEKNVREAQNQELLARVQEQERRISEQQAQLEQSEQFKNSYYENNLQTREAAILNELKTAKEEGNIENEIALSKELAKVTAEQSTYGLYKSQSMNQPRQPYYDNRPVYPNYPVNNPQPSYYEEPVNEAYDMWLENNSWADPESRNYSPRLRQEADRIAEDFNETLRYNGDAEQIGTPAYFKVIDNVMSERYGVKNQEQDSEPKEYQSSNVAPVSRSGSSMSDQYVNRNPNNTRRGSALTEEEYKIARNLQIKMPNGKWATGDEAVRRYAEYKKMSAPGGSQKITIE